ncbi:ALP1-like protein [Tanacetum coccineum]
MELSLALLQCFVLGCNWKLLVHQGGLPAGIHGLFSGWYCGLASRKVTLGVSMAWAKGVTTGTLVRYETSCSRLPGNRLEDNEVRKSGYMQIHASRGYEGDNIGPKAERYKGELTEVKNIGYWHEPNPHESPVEQVATSPKKTKKPTRARQKRTIQSDDAPRQIAWTTEEEIELAKGWVAISENSKHGNARKQDGFWCEVLQYTESKKNSTVVEQSGAGDEDYINMAMIHYQVETGLRFKPRHCWQVLKDSPKWQEITLPKFAAESSGGSKRNKSSGSSSFNTESGDASINLNTNVGDNDEDEVQDIRRLEGRDKARAAGKNKGSKASGSSTMNDDALARLMVTEMTTQEKEQRGNFLEIKRREVECRE